MLQPATLGYLADIGAKVRWECHGCEAKGTANLGRMLATLGPGYDLTDRTAACRQPGCTYWVVFYAGAGMRNWPLRTEAGMRTMMSRRSAWLTERHRLKGRRPHAPELD